MKKIMLSIILLLIAVGCSSKTPTSGNTQPFKGGTTGILLSFEQDAPPAEVFDGGDFPFDVVVKLKNDGEHDVLKDDVTVKVSGILSTEFGKSEAELSQKPLDDVLGTKKESSGDIQQSGPVFVEFNGLNHAALLSGNVPYRLRAEACYKYGTTAISQVCVRKNNLDTKDTVCDVNEDKNVASSSAPVQVTSFKETQRATDKIAFTFIVAHKGNGNIFQQATNCDTSSRSFEDKVWVEVESGMAGLECSGLRDGTATTGYVTLYGDDKPITCTQTVSTNSDYSTPVTIRLMYDYKDSIETTVLVKHALS